MAPPRVYASRALSALSKPALSSPSTSLPPPFLLPFITNTRLFNTTAPIIEDSPTEKSLLRPPPGTRTATRRHGSPNLLTSHTHTHPPSQLPPSHSPLYDLSRTPPRPTHFSPRPAPTIPPHLALLAAQGPFYLTVHLHGRPYLVTAGDTLRLPFLMHGVSPGDVLRLDCASLLGSRDFVLRAGSGRGADEVVGRAEAEPVVGRTEGLDLEGEAERRMEGAGRKVRFRRRYLDDRLFVCRATVVGTESEPMRVKEKTKRRQRRVKRVMSKHRYTILKISEISLTGVEELEAMAKEGAMKTVEA